MGSWSIEGGHLSIEQPHSEIYVARWSGSVSEKLFVEYERFCRPAFIHSRRPDMFGDYSAITGYQTHYRLKATEWLVRHWRHAGSMHVLLPDTAFVKAISITNAAINRAMHLHSDCAAFERAIRESVTQRDPMRRRDSLYKVL